MSDTQKIKIGISGCVLGEKVRYDGSHARRKQIDRWFSDFFEFTSFCPEVESGMGVPRPTLRLFQGELGIRLIQSKTKIDETRAVELSSRKIAARLKRNAVSGIVLKKDSPSCGMERVRVYTTEKNHKKIGAGIFAATVRKIMPNVPMEEDGRLLDKAIRSHFCTRVFAYNRWQKFRASNPQMKDLMDFHGANKLLLMAHDPKGQKRLGRLVAVSHEVPMRKLLDSYERLFMESLSRRRSVGRNVNVFQHVLGHLKDASDPKEYQDARNAIRQYQIGCTPYEAPLTLLTGMVGRGEDAWIKAQTFFQPRPESLRLDLYR